jgi:dTDP-glucose 4,6-dehydratase
MHKVAVIGAKSFTGGAFCRNLADEYKIIPFARPKHPLCAALAIGGEIAALGEDTTVVNFAALNMVAESWEHAPDYYRVNVVNIIEAVEELMRQGWKGRWVQVSTPEVYGNAPYHIPEGRAFNPSTPYAASRAACDIHLRLLHERGLDVVFTRSVNVYGPLQPPYRLIPKVVISILRGQRTPLHGGGVSKRDFLHVDDAVAGIHAAMTKGLSGNDYHIATGSTFAISNIVERIANLMGAKLSEVIEPAPERAGKDAAYKLSDSKLRAHTGWAHRIEFKDGLRETVEWYLTHQADYRNHDLQYHHKG